MERINIFEEILGRVVMPIIFLGLLLLLVIWTLFWCGREIKKNS